MTFAVQVPFAGIGTAAFLSAFVFLTYRLYRSGEGMGDFSVGITYRTLFLVILSLVPLFAAMTYLLTALGLGFIGLGRGSVSYLRYFEWMASTPLLLTGIAVLTRQGKLLLQLIALDIGMIASGLFAAILPYPYRLMPGALAAAAFLGIVYILFRKASEAQERVEKLESMFRNLKWFTVILWSLYPVFWIFSVDGLGMMGTLETVAGFMVLDIVAKIGYLYLVYYGFLSGKNEVEFRTEGGDS